MPDRAPIYPEDTIKKLAFPAMQTDGRELYDQGAVGQLRSVRDDFVAIVRGADDYTVVVGTTPPIQYTCSCGFAYGGACQHVVALMLAVNARDSVQTGLDFGGDADARNAPSQPGPATTVPTEIPTRTSTPTPRLYLRELDGMVLVDLKFAYCDALVEFAAREHAQARLVTPDGGSVVRVRRSKAREDRVADMLLHAGLALYSRGTYTPDDDTRTWLQESLPQLVEDGFEIYGRESLRTYAMREASPSLNLRVSNDRDFLTCTVEMTFDQVPAGLKAVFQSAMAGNRYVKLADGTTGVLPEEWLTRFQELLGLCDQRPQGDTIRLHREQVMAVDLLEGIADSAQWDSAALQVRQALSRFDADAAHPVPEGFTGTLRPYQLAGYQWFHTLRELKLSGVLADDMGLGKTVQTLVLLQQQKEARAPERTSLLVVPTSLLFNWVREARRFTPTLLVMQYHGANRARYGPKDMRIADVVLTTYGTVNRSLGTLKGMRFNYVILDEAQAIKNPLSTTAKSIRELQSGNRIALSGTPIENNLTELWSLFAFVNPGMLGPHKAFVTHYARPIERDRDEARASVLRSLVSPCILRRTKEQVAPDLPPKTENVIYCPMEPRQRTLYDITRDTYRSRIMQVMEEGGMEESRMRILEGLLRLRQICCHPLLMDPSFHGESGKFEVVDSCLEEIIGGGHKVLIFSQFVSALNLLGKRLSAQGIRFEQLTGKTRDRQRPVDTFQTDPGIPVMLISLKAGGTGLNLTAADYVIHLDPWWNPAVENQASARAHRIGQTKPVFVYKLVTENSVEERVVQLQEQKKELFDAVITTEESVFKRLTRQDVERLFG